MLGLESSFCRSLSRNGAMALREIVSKLLIRRLRQRHLLPQIGSQIGVRLSNSGVSGFGEVAQSSGRTSSGSVAVLNTSHLKKFLGDGG